MTVNKLSRILDILKNAGHGSTGMAAEHDQIFLAPPDFSPESDLGEKLQAAGALFSDSEGWYVFT